MHFELKCNFKISVGLPNTKNIIFLFQQGKHVLLRDMLFDTILVYLYYFMYNFLLRLQ